MWNIINMTHSDLDSDRLSYIKSVLPNKKVQKGIQATLDRWTSRAMYHNIVHFSRISQEVYLDTLPWDMDKHVF